MKYGDKDSTARVNNADPARGTVLVLLFLLSTLISLTALAVLAWAIGWKTLLVLGGAVLAFIVLRSLWETFFSKRSG